MSGKRVMASAIDWIAFSAIVPKNQTSQFTSFKTKCDGYLRR